MIPIELTDEEKTIKAAAIAANRFAYVPVVREDGCSVGIAIEGISGYHPTDYPSIPKWDAASKWAKELNTALGHSEESAAEIQLSSMRRG